MAVSKKELSDLVEKLSDKDVSLVADLIHRLISHPLDSNIPFDDEPLTDVDIKAIEKARLEFKNGLTINLKDIEDELRN
jgi:hypothetical protein